MVSTSHGTLRRLFLNRWFQLFLGTLASGGLAYAAFNSLAWREVFATFRDFPIPFVLLSLVPLVAGMVLRAYRWRVLMPDEDIKLRQVFITQNAGIGLNNLLPVRVGSEAFQLTLMTRLYKVPLPTALASLAGGNVLDIFATGLLMALGVLLVPGLRETSISIQLFGAVVMLGVSLLVMIGVSRGLGALPFASRISFFRRVISALQQLRDRPALLGYSFLATLFHWFLLGVSGWVLAEGLGMRIDPLTMATVLVAAMFFTSAMLSLPGGAGTYHFAVMSMLRALGVDPAVAFSFAVVMHILVFVPPIAIALFAMWRFGSHVVRRRGEIERAAASLEAANTSSEEPIQPSRP